MLYGTSEHLAECPDLGPECKSALPPTPYNHHVELFASDTTIDVAYGMLPWLAVEGRFILRVIDTTPTYSEVDGTEKFVPDDIHHHDRTIVGPGDPWLVFRAAAASGNWTTGARFGLSFPLGTTQPDPYRLGALGKEHEHTQLGTGTLVPIVGLGLAYRMAPVTISASGLVFFSIAENEYGFRAPVRYFAGVRGSLPLLEGAFTPYVALDVSGETDELWNGASGLEGSNVRADLLVGGGLAVRFLTSFQAELGVRGRAARFTSAAGFEYPGIVQLSLSTYVDLLSEKSASEVKPAAPPSASPSEPAPLVR